MTTTTTTSTASAPVTSAAAARLYDAESALHAARATGVDEWIAAAYDKLHLAVVEYEAAAAEAAVLAR